MAKQKKKDGTIREKVRSKRVAPACPFMQRPCLGPRCMIWHKAKDNQYSRCSIREIAHNLNNIGFRIGEAASGGSDSTDSFEFGQE